MTTGMAAAAAICGILGLALLGWFAKHAFVAIAEIFRARPPEPAAPDPDVISSEWHPCVLCDEQSATEPWSVVVANTKQDRDWFGHRALHGLAPMYAIRDAPGGRPALCKPHKRLIVRMLEETLAEIRALNAKHNALVERRLAQLEMGELLARAQVESASARQTIDAVRGREPSRELPARAAGTVTLLPQHDDDEAPE